MQETLSFSLVDGEVAGPASPGCLSVLLYPFISVPLFAVLLFLGLSRLTLPTANAEAAAPAAAPERIAPFFAAPVLQWEPQILEWAAGYELDPNLVATVMQIESCGDPQALSRAGAMGLFQVMPYHFEAGEDAYDAAINARRGLDYLARALAIYSDAGMALAAYNGGINGVARPQHQWEQETRDYWYWGTNVYADARAGEAHSPVLQEWMEKGGASLCAQAQQRLAGLP